ncbi:MAG TPA: peptidylprolyl isomerase [Desulfomicrobiaceae bacterium]|nr:peptidylprolyl isomerase [Desulfomicrobiaceae bacterium]
MANPLVLIETAKGEILVELYEDRVPETVANFLRYVDEEFYVGTLFHRVIKGFMVQCGGIDNMMKEKPTHGSIRNQATADLRNLAGTLAMARTQDPHSAAAQFFINTVDNAELDHTAETEEGYGYTVFGEVVEGMDVVKKIEKVRTRSQGDFDDVPVDQIAIVGTSRFE